MTSLNFQELTWPSTRSYRAGLKNSPLEFYFQSFSSSKKVDLLLGYFSTTAINILAPAFALFLYNGGTIRLIINNHLSLQDIELLKIAETIENPPLNLKDIKSLKETLSSKSKHFFECIAWLIKNKRIQIKVIRPKNSNGISHYKLGVMSDFANNSLFFSASCNFTAQGLISNLESVDCALSWDGDIGKAKIEEQNEYFEMIMSGSSDFIEEVGSEEIIESITKEFSEKDIFDLLRDSKKINHQTDAINGIERAITKIEGEINALSKLPRFPFAEGPREYQVEAYEKWKKNNYQGIFSMATGTGKTLTALNCVLQEFLQDTNKNYHVIILAPTNVLVDQWEKEVKKFGFTNAITISSKRPWLNKVMTALSPWKLKKDPFVFIATYRSFSLDTFKDIINRIPQDTVLIADEGHNIATKQVLENLHKLKIYKKICLTATPKRIYDPEGTEAMEKYFGDFEPYTCSFPLKRAIEEGFLCEYLYYPHIVTLTSSEFEEYFKITKKLAASPKGDKDCKLSTREEILLQERKRIIHKATNKLNVMCQILTEKFKSTGNLKNSLIYVPEGINYENQETYEYGDNSEESHHIIDLYTKKISEISSSICVNKYISGMKNNKEVLDHFKNGSIDIIAAMKCLDEGVDIPQACFAVFCSSTGNPRQFIQRRGRVLRPSPGKKVAIIHDLVVIPPGDQFRNNPACFQVERKLIQKELERVMYFASLSKNAFETHNIFRPICDQYNLNLYSIEASLE